MHHFSTLFCKELYIFLTDLLSTIRSLNTLFTPIGTGICHTSYVAVCERGQDGISLADGNMTNMTNTNYCEYSIKTPDDGQ
jgi:hypothetical protein